MTNNELYHFTEYISCDTYLNHGYNLQEGQTVSINATKIIGKIKSVLDNNQVLISYNHEVDIKYIVVPISDIKIKLDLCLYSEVKEKCKFFEQQEFNFESNK